VLSVSKACYRRLCFRLIGEAPSDAAFAHTSICGSGPGDVPICYSNKSGGVFNLLRGDLGKVKDMTDGNSFVN
jgi:hypothetical protein